VLSCAFSASAISSELDQIISADTLEFAEGYDKRLRYAPRTVVIMERDQIERSGALNVAELLERVVGIHVTRSTSDANADTYVRGISGNWLILHNGVEIERTLPDLNSLPVADIERLEVFHRLMANMATLHLFIILTLTALVRLSNQTGNRTLTSS